MAPDEQTATTAPTPQAAPPGVASSLDVLMAGKTAPEAPLTADVKAEVSQPGEKKSSLLSEGGEAKAAEGEKPADASAPLSATDLKLPEGFKAEGNPEFDSFLKAFNDPALAPKDRAQAILDLHQKALADVNANAQKQWDAIHDKWRGEIAADKEFGTGDPKNPLKAEAKAAIAKVIDAHGGPAVREALDLTGAGNNPALVTFIGKISKLLNEGGHVAGAPLSKKPSGIGMSALYPDLPEA